MTSLPQAGRKFARFKSYLHPKLDTSAWPIAKNISVLGKIRLNKQ
ncbi:hypothetical protein [Methylomonas albis]|nr:hypothetical protein [Methylomonas albis]